MPIKPTTDPDEPHEQITVSVKRSNARWLRRHMQRGMNRSRYVDDLLTMAREAEEAQAATKTPMTMEDKA